MPAPAAGDAVRPPPRPGHLPRPRPRRARSPGRAGCPHIVVEVVSAGGEDRDYVEKREEYLRVGVREYWILDPTSAPARSSCSRAGDVWEEAVVLAGAVYRTHLLPGLEVRPEELLGPAEES